MTYRAVQTSLWTDPKVRTLSADGKLMFLYLVTNPHGHLSGIYYLPTAIAVAETGLTSKRIDTIWDTLSSAGLAWRDQDLEVVLVINMLRHQAHGPKAIASAQNQLLTLHKSPLIAEFVRLYSDIGITIPTGMIDTVSDRVSPQKQKQEQNQEQDKERAVPSAANSPNVSAADLKAAFGLFWDSWAEAGGRKVDRARSEDAFRAAFRRSNEKKPHIFAGTLAAALDQQVDDRDKLKRAGKFVPDWADPKTWLRGDRWQDDLGHAVKHSRAADDRGVRELQSEIAAEEDR